MDDRMQPFLTNWGKQIIGTLSEQEKVVLKNKIDIFLAELKDEDTRIRICSEFRSFIEVTAMCALADAYYDSLIQRWYFKHNNRWIPEKLCLMK